MFDPSLRLLSVLLPLDLFDIIDTVSISLALVASFNAWLIGRMFLEHRDEIGRMFADIMFRFCSRLDSTSLVSRGETSSGIERVLTRPEL